MTANCGKVARDLRVSTTSVQVGNACMHLSQLTLQSTITCAVGVRDDIALSVLSEFSFTPFHIHVATV
jgi:hypothetical protein